MRFANFEEGDGGLEELGLSGQLLRRRGHFLGSGSVLLDYLVQLLDRLVDLAGAGILLGAGGGNLPHQFRRSLNIGHQLGQQLTGPFRRLHAVDGEPADFSRGHLAALRQLAHFRGDHRKSLAVFAGAGRFDGGVQRQQVRLAGDFFDNADFLRHLFHGAHGSFHRDAAQPRIVRRFGGDLIGLARIVGVLLDAGRHLFHSGGGFLGGGRLLGRALRQLLRRRAHLLAAGGDIGGGRRYRGNRLAQIRQHLGQRLA